MTTKTCIPGWILAIVGLIALTGCLRPLAGSPADKGAAAAATLAAAEATQAAAQATKAAAAQAFAQATQGAQRPATASPTGNLTCVATPSISSLSTSSAVLVAANFDTCSGTNNLGGQMGAAYNPPDSLKESYTQEADRGCVARLEYSVAGWSALWLKLQGADLRTYSKLVFDVRADPAAGIPREMKLELKRKSGAEVSIHYVLGIEAGWKTISVALADFGPAGYGRPVSSWSEMEELVFTFESSRAGRRGVVYLDNIIFAP